MAIAVSGWARTVDLGHNRKLIRARRRKVPVVPEAPPRSGRGTKSVSLLKQKENCRRRQHPADRFRAGSQGTQRGNVNVVRLGLQ